MDLEKQEADKKEDVQDAEEAVAVSAENELSEIQEDAIDEETDVVGDRPTPKRPVHPHALQKRPSSVTFSKQKRVRVVLFVLNSLTTFLFVGAGLAFGPMQLMLEDNGSFSNSCTVEEQSSGMVCDDQRALIMKLALLIPSMQLVSPLVGMLVDRYGPKTAAYSQGCLCISGWLLVIAATSTMTSPLLFVGFAAVSLNIWLGSQLIVQLGLYFEGHTISRVISILNALFGGGGITFLFMWWINNATGKNLTRTLAVYTSIGALLFAVSAYFWSIAVRVADTKNDNSTTNCAVPSTRFSHFENLVSSKNLEECIKNNASVRFSQRLSASTRMLDIGTAGHGLDRKSETSRRSLSFRIKSTKRLTEATIPFEEVDDLSHVDGYVAVADRNPRAQLSSTPFLLLCFFFGLQVSTCNWNTATQKDFLVELGDTDHTYLTIFTFMTPASILGAPLIDILILHFGWSVALQSINAMGVAYMTIKVVSTNLNVQVVGFVFFAFYRSFLFGISYSFLPSLIASPVVGRAAGIMAGVAGVVSLMMIPMVKIAVGQDVNFFVPNTVMLALCLPTTIIICFLGRFIRLENEIKTGPLEANPLDVTLDNKMLDIIEEDDDDDK